MERKEPNMNCRQVHKHIIGHSENTIPGNLRTEIGNHLKTCNQCSELYQNIIATYNILNERNVPEVSPFFYSKLEQKLIKKVPLQQPAKQFIWKLQPIAASFLILIGVGMGVFIGKNLSTVSESTLNVSNRTEMLEAYASDYYLTGTIDENIDVLTNNE